jgi:plasmid stability protein
MPSIQTQTPAGRPGGSRKLIATLEALRDESHVLEVVALRPADEFDAGWMLGGDAGVARRLSGVLRTIAAEHGGTWYRLDRLLYAVVAPAAFTAGTAAMAARMAVASTSPSLESCVFHGSATVPDEETGTQALALAFARLQARARWSSRSSERQVRDVLLQMLAERRTGSSPHVAEMAIRVGRKLGLGLSELDVLVRAGELQDVGKVLIPDAIRTKATPLNPAEWEIVRRHPIVAEQILAAAPALAPVARLVRCSQERYDGEGYPDRLRGEAIPIGARVIAVCVAFDAMTTPRPYREAQSAPDAIAEICRCAGRQFDPLVVAAFCAVVDESGDMRMAPPARPRALAA